MDVPLPLRLIGIVGASGSGKTMLIAALLPRLRSAGLRVSTVKHAHHGFDIDRPGKDSFVHREAGAEEVMIVSAGRWALLHEIRHGEEPQLADLLARMTSVDLVLVEGFKSTAIPKIEVFRPALGKPPFYPRDSSIVAIASDESIAAGLPLLPLDDAAAIARFILDMPLWKAA